MSLSYKSLYCVLSLFFSSEKVFINFTTEKIESKKFYTYSVEINELSAIPEKFKSHTYHSLYDIEKNNCI